MKIDNHSHLLTNLYELKIKRSKIFCYSLFTYKLCIRFCILKIYIYIKKSPPPFCLKCWNDIFVDFFVVGGGELGRLFVYFIFRGMGWWLRQGTDAGSAYVQCKFIWDLKRQHILLRIENTSIFAEYSMNVIEMSFASNYIFIAWHPSPVYVWEPIYKYYLRAYTFIFVDCFVWLLSFFSLQLILQLSAGKNLIRISSIFYSRIRISRRYRVIVTLNLGKICIFPRQTAHGV